jgi:predicted anti-sigma-YlaC factor YlaD
MSCDHGTLLDYLDGELDATAEGRVEHHLEGCEACRRWMERQRVVDRVVLDELAEPATLSDTELREMLDALPQPRRRSNIVRLGAPLGLALAAAAALSLLLVPEPMVESSTPEVAQPEAQDRVEMRLSTGDPSIQVVWIMDRNLDL